MEGCGDLTTAILGVQKTISFIAAKKQGAKHYFQEKEYRRIFPQTERKWQKGVVCSVLAHRLTDVFQLVRVDTNRDVVTIVAHI